MWKKLFYALIILLFSSTTATSAVWKDLQLSWSPNPEAVKYEICYAGAPGVFDKCVDIGMPEIKDQLHSYRFEKEGGFPEQVTCYLYLAAYNAAGEKSKYTQPIVLWPPEDYSDGGGTTTINELRFYW